MSRSAESILHETDYWIALLGDLRLLNDIVLETSQHPPGISVEMLGLVMGEQPDVVAERVNDKVRLTLDGIQRMQTPLNGLIELAGGRIKALEREKEAA